MSLPFRSLLIKSAQLQRKIDDEHKRRAPDGMRLLRLKLLLLRTKDRLRVVVAAARGRSPFDAPGGPPPMLRGSGRDPRPQPAL